MKDNNETNDDSIRLQGSGHIVDYNKFPESVIATITEVFKNEPDPHAVLIVYSYIFCGLTINKLRDIFILSDGHGTRFASREYIRQKIVKIFKEIMITYRTMHGPQMTVGTINKDRNISNNIAPFPSTKFANNFDRINVIDKIDNIEPIEDKFNIDFTTDNDINGDITNNN